ncbi:hypothetical protein Tco_1281861 [Tanacetum coccineum]
MRVRVSTSRLPVHSSGPRTLVQDRNPIDGCFSVNQDPPSKVVLRESLGNLQQESNVAAVNYEVRIVDSNQSYTYRFNFMNTKIYIDNESTICIVKNPVYHSKTKHIAIRHHFIRDAYEKKLIQVLKIHTDDNVADLLTKAFDVSRFQFLVVTIGCDSTQNMHLVKCRQYDLLESLGRALDGTEALSLLYGLKRSKHFSGKVTPLFSNMLVQPIEDEGEQSERPSEPQPTPFTPHPKEYWWESRRSSQGNKTLEGTDQEAQEESQTCYHTPQSLDEECILEAKIGRKEILKEKLDAKGVYTLDYMDTEDAQDVGRTRDVVNEEKESAEDAVSTEGVVSTDKEKVSTDRPNMMKLLLKFSQHEPPKQFKRKVERINGKKKIEEEMSPDTKSEKEVEEVKKLAEEEATKAALLNEYDFIQARIEADRLLALRLQDEEREKFTVEERAKFLHDTIHIGNKKHSDLKNKTFEEIQALYEKVKRFDESFTAVGSTEDERNIKEMNEGAKDLEQKRLKKKVAKETPKTEDTTKVPAKVDVTESCTKKSKVVICKDDCKKRKDLNQMVNKGEYLVIHRANGNFRAFNYLLEVLHIFDRQDLNHLYNLMMEQYSEITLKGFELILWGDLKIMMESSTEENDQSDFWSDQQD